MTPSPRPFVQVVREAIERSPRSGLVFVCIEELRQPLNVNLAKRYVREGIRDVPSHADGVRSSQRSVVVCLQPSGQLLPELEKCFTVESDWIGPTQLTSEHLGEPRVEGTSRVLVVCAHVIRSEHRKSEK